MTCTLSKYLMDTIDFNKHDILEKRASVRSELTRKHNKPMGNLQVIEALFGKWFMERTTRKKCGVCLHFYI
jgi:hypothetical protein